MEKPTENGIYYTTVEMAKKTPTARPLKRGVCKKGSINYYTKTNELWHGNQSKQGNHPTKPNDDSGFGDGSK